jgi:hypothetical protein
MALPANIRVNVRVPFPALVVGSGLITVTKNNGVWTIGFNPALIPIQNPLLNPGADGVLVYDAAAKMMVLASLQAVAGGARTQRSIKVVGNLPIVQADSILNINAVTDLVPVVPLSTTRNGAPLTFKNLIGSHTQTLTPTGADTFDGFANRPLVGGASMTLVPFNDGVNSGYGIE